MTGVDDNKSFRDLTVSSGNCSGGNCRRRPTKACRTWLWRFPAEYSLHDSQHKKHQTYQKKQIHPKYSKIQNGSALRVYFLSGAESWIIGSLEFLECRRIKWFLKRPYLHQVTHDFMSIIERGFVAASKLVPLPQIMMKSTRYSRNHSTCTTMSEDVRRCLISMSLHPTDCKHKILPKNPIAIKVNQNKMKK